MASIAGVGLFNEVSRDAGGGGLLADATGVSCDFFLAFDLTSKLLLSLLLSGVTLTRRVALIKKKKNNF